MIPKPIKRILLLRRLPPLVTIVLAPVSFILSILALVSQGNNGMSHTFTVALNTSSLLQNVLKVESVPSVTARGIDPMITPPPVKLSTGLEDRQLGAIGSFFGSIETKIGSKISTALNPTGTGLSGNLFGGSQGSDNGSGLLGSLFDGNGPLSGLLNGTGSFSDLFTTGPLGDIINKVGGDAAVELVNLINKLIASLGGSLSLADQYSVYMRDYCSGNYTNGTQTVGSQSCSALRAISIPTSNSTLQIGNKMIDYSALNIPNKLSGGGAILTTIFDAIFAFEIIGIVSTGLAFLISLPLLFSAFQLPILRALAGTLATVASIFLSIVSIIQVAIAALAPMVVNTLGDGLGVEARRSAMFIAFLVVSPVFMEIVALLWSLHLLVTWHDHAYLPRDQDDSDGVVNPMASGRPIIKPNRTDAREKDLPAMKLASPPFGRFMDRSPGSPAGVGTDGQVTPAGSVHASIRDASVQRFKAYRPSDRSTVV